MCPLCIGTALYLLSGAGSAGGATALTVRSVLRRRTKSKPCASTRLACASADAACAKQQSAGRSQRFSSP